MNRKISLILANSCIFFSAIFAVQNPDNERWINVTGIGIVASEPDHAVLRLGVVTTEKNAKLSTEKNNKAIQAIFEVLEEMGVDEDDFETENFNISPQRQYRNGSAPQITGYQVTNSLVVRIYDLDAVGEIMQAAINSGGNHFESLSYRVENDDEYLEEARIQAMENALMKAKVLAGTVNAKVGPVLTIQELFTNHSPMRDLRMRSAEAMMDSVPVKGPSELITEIRVQVKFALE